VEKLRVLYGQSSKHSNYQILPECMKPLLEENELQVKSRYEKERLFYILQYVNPTGKSILDIGGNSGYFSFEMISRGAKYVDYFEGNTAHAEFVKLASTLTGNSNRLKVFNEYFDFDKLPDVKYDLILLLNVLHHVGDDYGDKGISILKAKRKIIESLNSIASSTKQLIFQFGFCWKGNRNLLFFENGSKEEMIEFMREHTKERWVIEEIGIPEKGLEGVTYSPLNGNNILRQDELGEFLNRPLFIMKSKI
jgi:2-polyprenyl-3-methyl-5-hydroxy-6-metoxy-1,4-benzoquinol methylase